MQASTIFSRSLGESAITSRSSRASASAWVILRIVADIGT